MAAIIDVNTYHFVGGPDGGSKTGAATSGGGCTFDDWFDITRINQDFSKIMDANGLPFAVSVATVSNSGGVVRLTQTAADDFTGIIVGTIVNIIFAGGPDYPNDRYLITAVDVGGTYIEIDLAHNGNNPAGNVCSTGGAFDTLINGIDSVGEGDNASRWIWDNKDEAPGAVTTLNISGAFNSDYHIFIKGFKIAPGDMDIGGTYYGGALDAYAIRNSYTGLQRNANAAWVEYDLENGAYHGFSVDATKLNLHFENFNFIGIKTSQSGIEISDTDTRNIAVRNCQFHGFDDGAMSRAITSNCSTLVIDDCYAFNHGRCFDIEFGIFQISNCVIEPGVAEGTSFELSVGNLYGGLVYNCLMVGGGRGVLNKSAGLVNVINNTFVNQTSAGVGLLNQNSSVNVLNNIFFLAAQADFGVVIEDSGAGGWGIPLDIDYNCFFSAAGALTNPTWVAKTSVACITEGPNNIYIDPQFIDIANGVFTLQEGSPCINTGKEDAGQGYSNIGFWQRKSFLGY